MSFLRTAKAVGWALIGVRNRKGYEEDLGGLKPHHILITALLAVVLLVGGLIALVHWVV